MIHRLLKKILSLPLVIISGATPKKNTVGGQAIIEGVMMRGKENVSWSVRVPDGSIATEKFAFISIAKKIKVLGLPVLRGAVMLFESMSLGLKAIERSALLSMPPDENAKEINPKTEKFLSTLMIIVSLAISVGLFMYLPMLILSWLGLSKSAIMFNVYAGIIRMTLFLTYLIGISFMKDIKRMFMYHGAEHKAIFTYEDGKELTLDNMRPYTTFHPRCGTSFIVISLVIIIFLFSIIDVILIKTVFTTAYPVPLRLLVHLLLIPLVSGTSYEILKFFDRFQTNPLVAALMAPGLWLQRITTKQPDDSQLTVAAESLKAVL